MSKGPPLEDDLLGQYLFQFHLTALPLICLTYYLYIRIVRGGTFWDLVRPLNPFDERMEPIDDLERIV